MSGGAQHPVHRDAAPARAGVEALVEVVEATPGVEALRAHVCGDEPQVDGAAVVDCAQQRVGEAGAGGGMDEMGGMGGF